VIRAESNAITVGVRNEELVHKTAPHATEDGHVSEILLVGRREDCRQRKGCLFPSEQSLRQKYLVVKEQSFQVKVVCKKFVVGKTRVERLEKKKTEGRFHNKLLTRSRFCSMNTKGILSLL
jgi:hypothetical protein